MEIVTKEKNRVALKDLSLGDVYKDPHGDYYCMVIEQVKKSNDIAAVNLEDGEVWNELPETTVFKVKATLMIEILGGQNEQAKTKKNMDK